MAIDANTLTDYAEVKEYLKLGDDTDQAMLEDLINRASAFIEDVALGGREIAARTNQVEYYDGRGLRDLTVKNYPIIAVNTIFDDPDYDFDSDTLIAAADYQIYADEGIITLTNGLVFYKGIRNVQIDYDYGYATIPREIEMVAIELVAMKWADREKKKLGRTSEKYQDGSVAYFIADLLPQHKQVLKAYKALNVAGV